MGDDVADTAERGRGPSRAQQARGWPLAAAAEPLLLSHEKESAAPGHTDARCGGQTCARLLLAACALALCCGPLIGLAGGGRAEWPRLGVPRPRAYAPPPHIAASSPPPSPRQSPLAPGAGPLDPPAAVSENEGESTGGCGSGSGLHADLPLREDFDFVIVGAGSTGSILGARLAEAGFSVLLLEAGAPTQAGLNGTDFLGGANLTVFDVPLAWPEIGKGDARWRAQYRWSVPASVPVNIARGIGGGGAQNAMISVRGQPMDFVDWGEGWQWDNVIGCAHRAALRPLPAVHDASDRSSAVQSTSRRAAPPRSLFFFAHSFFFSPTPLFFRPLAQLLLRSSSAIRRPKRAPFLPN